MLTVHSGVFEVVEVNGKKHYDLVVIGGGSGGLACSKEGEYDYDCKMYSPSTVELFLLQLHHVYKFCHL